eukprot:gene6066-biopygen13490
MSQGGCSTGIELESKLPIPHFSKTCGLRGDSFRDKSRD